MSRLIYVLNISFTSNECSGESRLEPSLLAYTKYRCRYRVGPNSSQSIPLETSACFYCRRLRICDKYLNDMYMLIYSYLVYMCLPKTKNILLKV